MKSSQKLSLTMGLMVSLMVGQSGCSFLGDSVQPLTVSSTEKDADLYVDGHPVGRGTAQTMVARDQNHLVMARKGDRMGTIVVGTQVSTLGVLDLVGGIFWAIPFVGLLTPGARSLDRDQVTVVLP